jgi:hypothetical protein
VAFNRKVYASRGMDPRSPQYRTFYGIRPAIFA